MEASWSVRGQISLSTEPDEVYVADITTDDFEDRLEDDFDEGSGASSTWVLSTRSVLPVGREKPAPSRRD
jgi:hypothetical protein